MKLKYVINILDNKEVYIMKKVLNYISVFMCAFLLLGSALPVSAADVQYSVYAAGEKITKDMGNGKKVNFTVIKDEGVNSKYAKVIANPSDLAQFGVSTSFSYTEINTAITEGTWSNKAIAILDTLKKAWGGNIYYNDSDASDTEHQMQVLNKAGYTELLDEYSTEKYNKKYSELEAAEKTAVDNAIATALKGQSFWVINSDTELQSDRVLDGKYTTDVLEESGKAEKKNVTVTAYICKEAKTVKKCKYDKATKKFYGANGEEVTETEYKKQCEPARNPNTADRNNILVLSVIAAGCVICIVTLSKKMLAK